ncbi:peptidyl-prolyl cis-trans isomerase FKBP11 [Oncorhynchus mykiss]|uniref:peptidylprolyl isomerase n=2 Tax=Oncorhynchus TaxID=8016 RepID=A0A8C7RGW0_ONCMY|nr:peptidyl-prolyl cis-trans isomerase FKBP11 [Oncorhynchus mykiss]
MLYSFTEVSWIVFQKVGFTMKAKTGVILVMLAAFVYVAAQDAEAEQNVVEELLVETLVKPETCSIMSEMGDTLQIHYTGKLLADGKVIDSSLSRDPLVVVLGKRTVIPGLEQSLVGVCEGQKIKTTIPPHLAYGKRGYPPTIPADAALEFEVEVMSLIQVTPWQKMVNDVFPLVCLGLVPTLLGMVGLYLYNKANAQRPGKKAKKRKNK